jgi:hypothetical protein
MPVFAMFPGKADLENAPKMTVLLNHAGTIPSLQSLDPIYNQQWLMVITRYFDMIEV